MKLLPAVFISFVADAKEKKVKMDIRESESLIKKKNSSPVTKFSKNFKFLMIFYFFFSQNFLLNLLVQVPPRHPTQRLKTLRRFAKEWLNDNFKDDDYSKAQTASGLRNIERFSKRIDARYNQLRWLALKGSNDEIELEKNGETIDKNIKLCFFYDPEQPHGGRPRDRRDDDDENLGKFLNISFCQKKVATFNKNGSF